jgi:PAS domain S-box-containing protein
VFWFSVYGLVLVGGVLSVVSTSDTSPILLLGSMATVAVVEGVTIYGSLQTTRQLREREERLQWAQRLVHLGYWRRDLETGKLEWSPETRRIFGWSEETEVTYEAFIGAVHPEDREHLQAAQENAFREGKEFEVEYRLRRPSGEERTVFERGVVRRDEDGNPVAIMGAVLDMTDQKEVERELRETKRLLEKTFESLDDAIFVVDPSAREIVTCNSTAEDIFGYAPDELVGRSTAMLHVDDESYREFGDMSEAVLEEEGRFEAEYEMQREDGEVIDTKHVVTPLEGTDWPKGVVSVVRDITAGKEREKLLTVLSEAVEQAGDGVLVMDSEIIEGAGPRIVYANPAAGEMTGYDPDELVGRTPDLLNGPETEPWVLQRVVERIEAGKPFKGEAIHYRKDGTPFVNAWNVTPVRDDDGTIMNWVSVQRDVTEDRRMEKRLLEVQDEERRRIDKEIHDEMGGLLTALQLTVDRARLGAEAEGMSTESFDEIIELLDELSSVARTISRRLHPGDLDDHGLVGGLSSLASKMEARHDLEVEVQSEVEPNDRFDSLIERTAYRVVQEALVNVVRHAETDTAQVHLHRTDGQLRLHVIDDGVGFDSAATEKKTYGLAGMTERVERFNGKLEICTNPGEGTRITAVLPASLSFPTI